MSVTNIEGQRFGRWIVLPYHCLDEVGKHTRWLCRCDCGVEKMVYRHSLITGNSASCGCLNKEVLSNLAKHGQALYNNQTPEYTAWLHMKQRCNNENCKEYKRYGGRGIKVCKRWEDSFELFFEDMGKRPSSKHSLDRLDNNGDYEPNNCRWATQHEQLRNTRRNRWLEANGEKLTIVDWALKFGVSYQSIQKHLRRGKSFEWIYNHHKKAVIGNQN